MPIEYAGGGVVEEHTAVREAVGVFDVTHLGKASVRGPGAAAFVNACLTNDLGRIGPARRSTRCAATTRRRRGRRPDRLPASPTTTCFLGPERGQHRRGGPPAAPRPRRTGVEVTDQHQRLRRARRAGPARRRGAAGRSGCRPGTTTCRFADADWHGRPVIVCRTGYTGEHGYELRAALGRRAGAVGRAARGRPRRTAGCPAGWAPGTRCAPRWATRCTARTCRSTSRRCRPVRLGGRLEEARVLGPRRAGRREGGRPRRGCCWGLLAAGPRHPARRTCQVRDGHGEVVGEVTSGTFSPTLKQGIGLALLDRRCGRGRRGRGRRARPRGGRDGRQAAVRAGPDPAGLTPSAPAAQVQARQTPSRRPPGPPSTPAGVQAACGEDERRPRRGRPRSRPRRPRPARHR